ncbi:Predicted Zn-dependent protease [Algoriphagus locisalis]|uniref:Predicted Zn-dependent protease n=1 Tax=Algoriphagus locisalis TaxID=305507 RepID=A0A1I7CC56_9BACT|nr:DUF2268 domain-containing putative Zn-dependent protease [Algoriphagus locisalis]SFT96990.1 Predicted Zn-dependent protease [Algoriphagus locisalis]
MSLVKAQLILLLVLIIKFLPGLNYNLVISLSIEPQIITSDISHFYEAFDLAKADPGNAKKIFNKHYFKKGSKGLHDFYKSKIQSKEKFAEFVISFQDYYQSIREDVSCLDDFKGVIDKNFQAFEKLYPEAQFPSIYFLVGKFQSNGTVSNDGILIGTEVLARTPHSDTVNWNENLLKVSLERNHIPVTVCHELVHFNQDKMAAGNTLLWKCIREGSAEFIAELISGETDADYQGFQGMEWEIWEDFQKDQNKSIWSPWQQASDARPRNAGYWMGYTICKAYFHQIKDTEQVLKDILTIQNYEEFLEKSKVEDYLMISTKK